MPALSVEPVTYPRFLISLAEEAHARLLANYLQSQQIQIEMRRGEAPYPYHLFIVYPEQWQQASSITEAFIANPMDKRFQEASWLAEKPLSKPISWRINPNSWMQTVKAYPVVTGLLFSCVLIFLSLFTIGASVYNLFQFQPIEQVTISGEWWRLWTPALLHFSVLHIVFNLLWWWILGKVLEQRFGHFFIVMFFLVTAISSNYAQFLDGGANFGGLSGVVYALFGFVWWVGWLKPEWGMGLPKPLVGFMLIWLVLGYADALWVNMANSAHSVGLLSGCFIALILCKWDWGIRVRD
ncbi:rhomboid family intramembrane serine protease GlpG [Paraneptunicella aestuarii]|uniref:rhomboid family intramembrane serine protease GlpG n=1 Tax=Paraneptunicella aestuarii TaxID=2831148 RepID=UPI001E403DEE|nr:rhomboid family intramembrane serine protease GlpG [Paraneptunicella aestuarii]UAA38862.1 rhomboid family intramembrane serine protease GlpG [Paraneptunicella aestuarii]